MRKEGEKLLANRESEEGSVGEFLPKLVFSQIHILIVFQNIV